MDEIVPSNNGFQAWQNAIMSRGTASKISLCLYPKMNHALLELPNEGLSLLYQAHVPAQLVNDLSSWIHADRSEVAHRGLLTEADLTN